MFFPKIGHPHDSHDFHDSSLICFNASPWLDEIEVIVSTPDNKLRESLWLIRFSGVLRFEYETLGSGSNSNQGIPLEIYDIYEDTDSEEFQRWSKRMKTLGEKTPEKEGLHQVILASSFLRGWERRNTSRELV